MRSEKHLQFYCLRVQQIQTITGNSRTINSNLSVRPIAIVSYVPGAFNLFFDFFFFYMLSYLCQRFNLTQLTLDRGFFFSSPPHPARRKRVMITINFRVIRSGATYHCEVEKKKPSINNNNIMRFSS